VAARRLLVVMLVLLGVSILITALFPGPTERDGERESTERIAPAPPQPTSGGELVTARIDADREEPATVSLQVGDQLALTVRSQRADEVEIPELGLLEVVAPLAPARFDILAWEEATYSIRLVEEDRVIGRIEVEPDGSAPTHPKRRLADRSGGSGNGEER
jgi:hypothetical protein